MTSSYVAFLSGALKHFLRVNDQINVSPAEFHHFSNDTRYRRGLDVYMNELPASNSTQLTMEGSPGYWPTAPKSAGRIYSMDPCVKLILAVIDPAERLESHYAHITAKNMSFAYRDGTFVRTFHDYYFYPNGTIRTDAVGIEVGRYAENMKKWLTYFPFDRIFVVDGSMLKRKPWVPISRIERFLGLQGQVHKADFYRRSDYKVFCHKKVGCLTRSKGRKHPYVDPTDREILRKFYKSSNEEFFKMIGRRLSWAY